MAVAAILKDERPDGLFVACFSHNGLWIGSLFRPDELGRVDDWINTVGTRHVERMDAFLFPVDERLFWLDGFLGSVAPERVDVGWVLLDNVPHRRFFANGMLWTIGAYRGHYMVCRVAYSDMIVW